MEKNIAMQITHECNPDEARFRTGDFLIGTKNTLSLLKNQNSIFPNDSIFSDKYYTIENSTVEKVKESTNVKYHHVLRKTSAYNFTFKTITKAMALKHLANKKRIAIKHHDTRILEHILSDEEQTYFLNDVTQYESECVLNGDWITWTETNYKLPQINYYNSLKTDIERQIYADAIGQQYALTLLLGPIHIITDTYDLDCFNTFFKDIEFYFDDKNTQSKNDENEYVTSLRIKELWLPAEHFNLEPDTETKTVNGIKFIQIDDAIENYSFTNNRVKYDSHWYSDFLIKL